MVSESAEMNQDNSFYLKNPDVLMHNPLTDEPEESEVELNKSKPTLLLVEDNAEVRRFIKEIFEEKNNILEAENGEIALEIAKNIGKHPLSLNFITFSLGGALLVLGLCLRIKAQSNLWLKPLSYLGQNSMNAFILHIIIIFYFYRYYFALFHKVSYLQALGLTGLCVGLTVMALYLWNKKGIIFREA